LLGGGFVGVDIFFVISGFLITSIIMQEHLKTGSFSIASFYERRFRRLIPVLFVVILTSMPFAWNLLLPSQLMDFSKSIISSLAFASNFYWNHTLQEYGAESALLKPFLHTWSLAVEEQYYIVYPVLLLALYRWFKAYTFMILTAILLLSLQFAETMTPHNPSFSFYMLPSRFWELLCGGLITNMLYFYPLITTSTIMNRTMPIAGLSLIAWSMIFMDLNSHPGFITLVPVIGTSLIILFANENDIVTKLLSARPLVGIGLISYSLYLWHYPIFAFGRYLDSQPGLEDKALWILLTLILSLISYYLIEKPFRNKKKVSRKKLFISLAITFTMISSINAYWLINHGFESRLDDLKPILTAASRIWVTKDHQKCHSGGFGRRPAFPLSESCIFKYGSGKKHIIVVGDSHAGSLAESLRILSKENSYDFIQLTSAGCPHIKGFGRGICAQRSNQLISYLRKFPDSIIVYSARVPLFLEVEEFVNAEGEMEDNYKHVPIKYVNQQFPIRAKALVGTLNELKQISKKLVIVYPVPEQGFHIKDKLFPYFRHYKDKGALPTITTSYDRYKARTRRSYQILDSVTGNNIYRIYPEKIFCHKESGRCIVSHGDKIYFGADSHVSPLGSKLIVQQIAKSLGLKVNPFSNTLPAN